MSNANISNANIHCPTLTYTANANTHKPVMPYASAADIRTPLEDTDLHHLLPLKGLYLSRPTLAVTVAVAQLPVVPVTPAEHLSALR